MKGWSGQSQRRTARLLAALGAALIGATALPATAHTALAATWAVTLSASPTQLPVGSSATLTATANQDVSTCTGSPCYIDIYQAGDPNSPDYGGCFTGTTCSSPVSQSIPGTYCYLAYVDQDPSIENPPIDVLATSNEVCITWIAPSDSCNTAPNTVIVDGTTGNVFTMLIAKQNGPQTLLCYRFYDTAHTFYEGGAVVVQTPSLATPSIRQGTAACGSSSNVIPGPHPVVDENVLSNQVFFDTDSDGSTFAAACVAVDSIADSVVVPVAASGGVALEQDPGSLTFVSLGLGR